MSPGFVIDFPRTVRYILQKEIFNLTEKIANTLQNLRGLPTPSALTHTQPQNRKRRSRSLPVRRRGERNYGNAVLATTGGQERAGCLRMENGKKTAAASNKQTVLQAADTPPVPVRMWSEHAFHNSPAAPPYREGPAPPFSSPPHKIIQKEYKKIHFFFDRIFYYKGTSFMNETKRCISKSKNHIQTDKT